MTAMKEKKQRLFFALGLRHDTADFHRLCQLVSQCRRYGRTVPPENLHVTLAFLGNVTADQRDQLLDAATHLPTVAPFSIGFDQLGYWKRSKVIWLAPETPPPDLPLLATLLRDMALGCGIPQEERPYRPHLTLAKSVPVRPAPFPAISPLHFHFAHFGLYISQPVSQLGRQGVVYRCLRQWPLSP